MEIKQVAPAILLFSIIAVQTHARDVSHIEIKKTGFHDGNGIKGPYYENEKIFCVEFKPTKKQLIHFFRVAKEAKEYGIVFHEYYSPCIASGTVSFKDGTSGDWKIRSSGLATVFFDSGEKTTFFSRDNQWTDPFQCTYGSADEPEPGCEE